MEIISTVAVYKHKLLRVHCSLTIELLPTLNVLTMQTNTNFQNTQQFIKLLPG